jgi:hypothetical protein
MYLKNWSTRMISTRLWEESLTTVWDAKVYSWDNSKYPFNEWILNRVRGMGYKLDDLSYLHESVPLNETYKVTKQLCADTNLPEFRRMLNRFVREVVVPQGKLRLPVAVQRFMNVRIMRSQPTSWDCTSSSGPSLSAQLCPPICTSLSLIACRS